MEQSTNNNIYKMLQRIPVFTKLESPILHEIAAQSQIISIEPNQLLIDQSGPLKKEFYVLISGELEVFKTDHKNRHYSLNKIQSDQVFGEGIILGEHQRAASVRATTSSQVLVIQNRTIEKFSFRYTESIIEFGKTLHAQTVYYLNQVNKRTTSLIYFQKTISLFLINIVIFLSVFSVLVPYIEQAIKSTYSILATAALVFIGSALVFFRLHSLNLPLAVIGVTSHNLKKSITEATALSVFILLVIILIKLFLIHLIPGFSSLELFTPLYEFYHKTTGKNMSPLSFVLILSFYAVHAAFQEIIARGSIQGVFSQLFPEHHQYLSIIIASLVFASAHAYFGFGVVLLVFLPGLFWGWLYQRQGNIFGPIVSHIILGVGIVGFIRWGYS